MELIKRCHSSSPQTLPFPIAATTVVVAVFTRWALRIELQAPRVRERGFRCLLPSSALYDRPYPVFHPLSSLLLVPRCSRRQPLPNPRLVLRNYRRISANTADEYLEDRILQGRGLEKEYWKGGGYIYTCICRTGLRSGCSSRWLAALETSSNEAEDGSSG